MIRVRNIKLLIEEDNESNLKKKVCKKLRINSINSYKIVKKSIDARDKNNIYYVYELDIDTWPGIPTYVEVEGKDEKDLEIIVNKLLFPDICSSFL